MALFLYKYISSHRESASSISYMYTKHNFDFVFLDFFLPVILAFVCGGQYSPCTTEDDTNNKGQLGERKGTEDQSFIFTPKKGFCCRQRESIAFSSAANLLFSFIFLDGLKFYAGHILLYSEFFGCRLPIGYVSQVNRISTGEPLHNKYLRVLQSSQS